MKVFLSIALVLVSCRAISQGFVDRNYVDSLVIVLEETKEKPDRLELLLELCDLILYEKTDHDVQAMLSEASDLSNELNHHEGIIRTKVYYSSLYDEEQKYGEAIVILKEALDHSIKFNQDYFTASLVSSIGSTLDRAGRVEESLMYLSVAIQLNERAMDRKKLSSNYCAMGTAFARMKEQDSAIYYYEKAEGVVHDTDYYAPMIRPFILAGKGQALIKLEREQEAFDVLSEFVGDMDYERVDYLGYSIILAVYGNTIIALDSLNETQQAQVDEFGGLIPLFELCYEWAEMSGYAESKYYASKLLAMEYAKIQDYDKAYAYNMIVDTLEGSRFDTEQLSIYADLEMKYESAQKEQELLKKEFELDKQEVAKSNLTKALWGVSIFVLIVLIALWKIMSDRKKLADQKEVVDSALEEKELLLKEVHHRVKNNLQVISGLLNKQAIKSEDPGIKKMMEEGQSRIKSMAMIHQRLYENEDFANINMRNYTDELVSSIASSNKLEDVELDLNVDMAETNFHIDIAIPLGLILNELLTNVFKYAFQGRRKGKIDISIKKKADHTYVMEVADNGVGLPDNFAERSKESLGLSLVKGLSWQLRGDFSYESNEGSVFSVTFMDELKAA